MASIEERVVGMKFDNAQFERGVQSTLNSLANLNKGLQLQGATKGLNDIGAASQKVSLKNVENGVQAISDKFKAMSVVGIAALASIAHQAVATGSSFAKSLTIAPIAKGFREYELTLNSVQTILANTGREGKKGLAEVTKALDELNHYADKTIYNFGTMAKNIGTFTAAGVSLETSVASIKGIANLAAVSGADAEKASRAMYQLSQAIASGKVSLEDWNSVTESDLGGKVFKDSLIETAKVHGVNVDAMIKKEGNFRLTLQNGWLTSKILTETLGKFTGDLNAEKLKGLGYDAEQIKGILKLGKTANDAATKVKTMTQLIDTLQAGAESGWAETWKIVFGDFNEARGAFTGASEVLGKFIENSSDARNKVLGDWKALGGRTALIDAIGNAFSALISVMKPIGQAFRQIFPATTGKQLYDFTVSLKNFTESLKIGGETANNLKRTFAGVFAVFGIGWEIIKQVASTLFGLFGTVGEGSGGFLATTASIGDFLVALHKAVVEGEGLTKFFKTIGTILAVPIKLIQLFGSILGSVFEKFDTAGAGKSVTGLASKLEPLGRLGEIVATAWGKVLDSLGAVQRFFGPIGDKFAKFFSDLGDAMGGLFEGLDFSDVLSAINTGLFAALVLMFRKFAGGGAGGLVDSFNGLIEGLTGALGAMQNTLRAATLLQIAIAVGILAIAMNTLAKIDGKGLTRASAAITVMFTQLLGAMLIFEKFSNFTGFLKMPFIAASMILLGVAVNILASAVKKLSDLSWEELAKGLTGTTALLASIIAVSKLIANPAGLISTSIGLIALGAALKVLVSAVTDLSGLAWEDLTKGLVGVGALLGGLILFTKFAAANKGGLIQGAGIILLAAGIKILASAMKDLGQLHWEEIAKGLVAMGGALVIMGAALALIPPTAIFSAAGVVVMATALGMIGNALKSMGSMNWENIAKGLVAMAGAIALIAAALILIPPTALLSAGGILVVSVALGLIAKALGNMGAMSWEEIAKGLVALAGSLLVIAAAMIAMTGALPGAAALLVVSAALAILTPILLALGGMSWGEIVKGLVALAGVFMVLGVAGLVLGALVPVLIGLGVAITLLGVGVLAAGAGVLLFATGLTALAAAGAAGAVAIVAIVTSLVGVIPTVMKQIGLGIVAFANVIATAGPAITKAITAVLLALIKAIDTVGPKIVDSLLKMMSKMLTSMLKYVPNMVDTGNKLLIGVLNGIAKNIGGVIKAGTDVIVNFLNGVSKNLPRLVQAGFDLIIKFVNSLADGIRKNTPAMRAAGGNLAKAIIDGMTFGLLSNLSQVTTAARNVAKSALDAAKDFLGVESPSKEFEKLGKFVNQGFAKGLNGGSKAEVLAAFDSLKGKLKDVMQSAAKDVDEAEAKLKKLNKARLVGNYAIERAEAALAQARKEYKRSSAAYSELTKNLVDEKNALGKLASQYEKVTDRLKEAQSALADAKRTRDDYNKSITDQYSTLPDITGETKLADYMSNLKKEIADTAAFSIAIQRLRELGLNDDIYEDLLRKGTAALPFVQELLASGKNGVDAINALDAQLVKLAGDLGNKASKELYQASVDAAAAIVNGFKAEQAAIENAMDKIADAMIAAINKKLAPGIKKGAISAVEQAIKAAEAAAKGNKQAGDQLVDASGSINGLQPKISPVVDLSKVKKAASSIPNMFSGATTSVKTSYASAASISSANRNQQSSGTSLAPKSSSVTFNQYNSSPKALSPAEIYRQTSNQLSVAKKGA